MSQAELDLVIVGAGIAGLQALRECLARGLTAQCLEKDATPGGKWTGRGIYECVLIQQHKTEFHLPEMPWNEDAPEYLRRDDAIQVTYNYIRRYGLEPYIECRSEVESAEYDERDAVWVTRTSKGSVWKSRYIAWAVGTLGNPSIPKQVKMALKDFEGDVVHAHEYFRPLPYQGKHVVVLGFGASGVEIAQDLAKNGKCASVTMVAPPKADINGKRQGQDWCISRELPNIRTVSTGFSGNLDDRNAQLFAAMKARHPLYPECLPPLLRPSGTLDGREIYPREDGRPLGGRVIVSEGFCDCVSDGSVKCVPGYITDSCASAVTVEWESEAVVRLRCNAVIVCTGYEGPTTRIARVMKPAPSDCDKSLYKTVWMPDVPCAACIGHVYGFTSVPATCFLHARYLANVISGKVSLPSPSKMREWVAGVQTKQFVTQRLTRNEYFLEIKETCLNGDVCPASEVGTGLAVSPVKGVEPMCVAWWASDGESLEGTSQTTAADEVLSFWPRKKDVSVLIVGASPGILTSIKKRLTEIEANNSTFIGMVQDADLSIQNHMNGRGVKRRLGDDEATSATYINMTEDVKVSGEFAEIRRWNKDESSEWPVEACSMDLLLCALGDVRPESSFLHEVVRVLQPGGHAVMTMPANVEAAWEPVMNSFEMPNSSSQRWRLMHKTAPRRDGSVDATLYRHYVFRRVCET